MDQMEKNKNLKVVVFESANKDFFMNHHDVEHRLEVPDVPGAKPFFHEWPGFVQRLINCPVLSISKVRGRARALEIVLSAGEHDAELGERYGFINRAVPDDELDDFNDTLSYLFVQL